MIGESLLVAVVLMFVARPLAVYVFTLGAGLNIRESTLVGWAGLRGAVPIVLATFPVIDGVDEGGMFFNIVFFVVLASTLIQGVTLDPLAKVLRVTGDEPAMPRPLHEVGTIRRLGAEVLEYPVGETDAIGGLRVNQLELPREALVSVVVRDDEALLPARIDRGGCRRPAAHPGPRGRARRGRGAVRALALGPDRGARRGAQHALRAARRSSPSSPGPRSWATRPPPRRSRTCARSASCVPGATTRARWSCWTTAGWP